MGRTGGVILSTAKNLVRAAMPAGFFAALSSDANRRNCSDRLGTRGSYCFPVFDFW